MTKPNKMPTTKALLVLSWLVGILGLVLGACLIIFKFNQPNSIIAGALILFGGLFLSVLVRMLANMGQLLFDLKGILNQQLVSISSNLEQINCDSKDINQNIQLIKTFFEQIERHLDLKK